MTIRKQSSILSALGALLLSTAFFHPPALRAQAAAEAKNIELVGHNDLNGNGDGGEGLVIQQWPDGRRVLYLAHEGQKTCLSIVDVTHPDKPEMINRLPVPTPGHYALQLARSFRQRAGDRQPGLEARTKNGRDVGARRVRHRPYPESEAAGGPRIVVLRYLGSQLARCALPVVRRRRVRASNHGRGRF